MKTRAMHGSGWSFEGADKNDEPKRSSLIKKTPTGSLPPENQDIWLNIERRSAGKVVTVIGGLKLSVATREDLARKLKAACGAGGTIRDGKIEIQGDKRDQLRQWFIKNGWNMRSK